MTSPTNQPAVPTDPAAPAAPRRSRRWLWIAAAAVLIIAGSATVYALAGGGKDPGVTACERAAERAASGQRATASDNGDVQLLKKSQYDDLREVGETIERVAADGDVSDAMKVGVRMMAACARHGVVIDPA